MMAAAVSPGRWFYSTTHYTSLHYTTLQAQRVVGDVWLTGGLVAVLTVLRTCASIYSIGGCGPRSTPTRGLVLLTARGAVWFNYLWCALFRVSLYAHIWCGLVSCHETGKQRDGPNTQYANMVLVHGDRGVCQSLLVSLLEKFS